jgi:hypothetical protein
MNWAYNVWYGYTVPSLYGNGPEALVQTIVYGLIALIFVPPIRKWFGREYQKIHAKIDKGHAELHEKLDHNRALAEHLIHHLPDVPDFKPKAKP